MIKPQIPSGHAASCDSFKFGHLGKSCCRVLCNHSTREQKLPSSKQCTGSVSRTATLQGGFCQSGAAGALNLCAHYVGWCCNRQQMIFTITASLSSTFPTTFEYIGRISRPVDFTGTLIPHHCSFWTHPDKCSLPHSYWDLKTPPSDCDCKPGLIKALWKRSILEPFKKKKKGSFTSSSSSKRSQVNTSIMRRTISKQNHTSWAIIS